MADVDSSGSGLGVAPATGFEQQVLGTVPADSTGDMAALDAKIAEAASSIMGANINDPRYQTGGSSDTATEGVSESAAGDTGSAASGAGVADGGTAAEGEDSKTVEEPGDQSTQQAPPVEAPPVVAKEYLLTIQGADTVDAEGNRIPGKEYKVGSIDDLPEDFQPRHNRQIMEIIRNFDKLEAEKERDAVQAATHAEQQQAQVAQAEMLSSWDKEISQLQKEGRLDAPKLKQTDPGYLTDPAMKLVADVFGFMEKTNKARSEAGSSNFIRSFEDALDKMERVQLKEAQAKAAKAEVETAKLKASVVGGGTAKAGSGDAPVYIAGQAAGDIRNML